MDLEAGLPDGFEGFRLSPQQRRLWLLQPGTEASPYRAVCVVRIAGELDRERLRQAAHELVERHEILRTSFQSLPGVAIPVQVIGEACEPPMEMLDLEAPDAEAAVESLFATAPATASPLALTLAPLGPAEHLLRLDLSALRSDAPGIGLLALELGRIYLGEPAQEEEPMQYADLAEWQNELLGQEEGRDFWRRQDLSGLLDLTLPEASAAAAPGGALFDPRILALPVTPEESTAVDRLAGRCDVPWDTVLLALWQILLWRSSGHSGFVVGFLADGRRYAEVKTAPGLLARTVPLEAHLEEQLRFLDFLPTVARSVQEARRRQEYFAPEEASRIFAFGFEAGEHPEPVTGAVCSFTLERRRAFIDRFTIQLSAVLRPGGLEAELCYDAGVLPPAAAERLAGRFATLLRAALERPEAEVGSLSVLGAAERRELLAGAGGPGLADADLRPVHRRFEERARRAPRATALIHEKATLTFQELNDRANRLARHLRSLGVGPESRVAICLERSPEMVSAVLAVLKAGGAFVPLDPEYPAQRLGWILEDSGALVLVTRRGVKACLPEHSLQEVDLDAAGPAIAAQSAQDLAGDPEPEGLAYVLYTSGSTGRPKGVGVPHSALSNYLAWLEATYPLREDDRLLLKTPASFDVSVRELFWPLVTGTALVVAIPGGHRDSAYLARLIAEQGITAVNFVPSMLALFLEEPGLAACHRLTRVLSGGEALPVSLRDRFFERLNARLYNHYGPTECTITATWWPCEPEDGRRRVPIGRPLANTRVLVLDRSLEPVPAGAPGELAIAGAGLARGYLGRPEATALAFTPDPHGEPGGRLYRTGDLARRLPDGSLDFLGRADSQIKIRGFRIELGEIEHALLEHPSIDAAMAMVREDAPGDRRLVAYAVPALVAPSDLRDWLRGRLPEYMVPAAIVPLDALPLSPSGKVDRGALPEPERVKPGLGAGFVAPRDPIEEAVADVWAEVLKLDKVGIEDDFFALGGHSLLAMQLVSRLQETFRTPLPLRLLFMEPTVARLSRSLVAAEKKPGQSEKIARALKRVKELSEEGVRDLLAGRQAQGGGAT